MKLNRLSIYLQRPESNRTLYVLLLIATPFLLLQNYLQPFIGSLSEHNFTLYHFDIPYILLAAFIITLLIMIAFRKHMTIKKLIGWGIVLVFFWIGQKSTDYYFNHDFYELQYNWHYFAYSIFAFLNYRVLKARKTDDARLIFSTFLYAMVVSTFDELIQIPLSNRIFDLGDIAKDLWGTVIGLFILFFIVENGRIFADSTPWSSATLKGYFGQPKSAFLIITLFAWVFMITSSVLTDSSLVAQAIVISVIGAVVLLLIMHLLTKKTSRKWVIGLLSAIIMTQLVVFYTHRHKGITYCMNKTLVYNGIPLPYFDVIIYPDGWFRLADKKRTFSQRDIQTIKAFSENILIIGTGSELSTNIGFPKDEISQFVFNINTNIGLQVITLDNVSACQKFNQLRQEGKKPTLILHHD